MRQWDLRCVQCDIESQFCFRICSDSDVNEYSLNVFHFIDIPVIEMKFERTFITQIFIVIQIITEKYIKSLSDIKLILNFAILIHSSKSSTVDSTRFD